MEETQTDSTAPELVLVMPAFNEGGFLESVVREWREILGQLRIPFVIAVYDDGSTDGTPALLARLVAELPELRATTQANRGHGPTILRGYREADAPWIAQSDTDGEVPAREFPRLWEARASADLVLGAREHRTQGAARKLLTLGSRAMVRALFGRGVRDVNTPCRLMRREAFTPLLQQLPEALFAPNVALSGLAVARGLRVLEIPVRFDSRRGGEASLIRWKIWRAAIRSGVETFGVARRARSGPG